MSGNDAPRRLTQRIAIWVQAQSMSLGQQTYKKGTGVMPSAFVLCAGVAEPDDESDGRQGLISPRRRLRHPLLPVRRH